MLTILLGFHATTGVSDVRRLCGCGLELELGMTTPPSWGEFVLTGGHQLPVKGNCLLTIY